MAFAIHKFLRSGKVMCLGNRISRKASSVVRSPYPDINLSTLESKSLASYIFDKTHLYSDKIAMIDVDTCIKYTYSDVKNNVETLCKAFTHYGLKKKSIAAISCFNCIEYAVIVLALNLLQITVMPLNPTYKMDELKRYLKLTSPDIFIFQETSQSSLAMLDEFDFRHVFYVKKSDYNKRFMSIEEIMSKSYTETLDTSDGEREGVAILPLSSGTTGLPKAVSLTNYNLLANLKQLEEITEISDNDVLTAVLPFFHIYGFTVNLFLPLCQGACLLIPNSFNAKSFIPTLKKYDVTYLMLVPPIFMFLSKQSSFSRLALPNLQKLLNGAAPLSKKYVLEIKNKFDEELIFSQGYGMTELSPVTHLVPFVSSKCESIGIPIANTLCKISDISNKRHPTSLSAFEHGELCIKGPQVMLGYFNSHEATNAIMDENGWLHTGDLAYYDEEGFFYIIDRIKDLIKYKGNQISPSELEVVLLSHPQVVDACVIAFPDEAAGQVPKAFIVPSTKDIDIGEVERLLSHKLSSFKKIRGGIEIIESIPRSQSGKIMRKMLKSQ